jgi:hypothetical protein
MMTDRRVIQVENFTDFNRHDELERSDKAHEAAKADIYPALFAPRQSYGCLVYSNGIQDGGEALREDRELGIDTTISWQSNKYANQHLATPITTIQERCRHPKFARFSDLTITVMNPTGHPGDWFKCKAEFYLYGYFDMDENNFEQVYLVRKSALFSHILNNRRGVSMQRNTKGQSFLCVDIGNLRSTGAIVWEQCNSSIERFFSSLDYGKRAV